MTPTSSVVSPVAAVADYESVPLMDRLDRHLTPAIGKPRTRRKDMYPVLDFLLTHTHERNRGNEDVIP